MTIPSAHDVIEFLQGYDLELTRVSWTESVTADAGLNQIVITGGYSYQTGDKISFGGTTAPTPLVAGVVYYAIAVDATHIQVALTYANALAGTAVDLTGTGTAVTLSKYNYQFLTYEWITSRMVNRVIPFIEGVIRQTLGRTLQVTEYLSGTGKDLLLLSRKPIVSLDQIAYVLMGDSGTYVLHVSSVEVIAAEGILKAKRSMEMNASYMPVFTKGSRNIKVTYTVGFADTPADLCEAVLYLTAEMALGLIASRTGGGNPGSQATKAFGNRGMYTEIRNDLARQAMSILDNYKTGIVG